VRRGLPEGPSRLKRPYLHGYVHVLTSVTGGIGIYNLVELVADPAADLQLRIRPNTEPVNYKLGFAVQSLLVSLACFLLAASEVLTILVRPLLPFVQKDISRSTVHVIVAGLALGFCGGVGLWTAILEFGFAVVCYLTATVDAWNRIETDSGDLSDPTSE
jgi:hypothetical protein